MNNRDRMEYRWSTTASTGNYNPAESPVKKVRRRMKELDILTESVPLQVLEEEDGTVEAEQEKKEFLFDPTSLEGFIDDQK